MRVTPAARRRGKRAIAACTLLGALAVLSGCFLFAPSADDAPPPRTARCILSRASVPAAAVIAAYWLLALRALAARSRSRLADVAVTVGCFDLTHKGHELLFRRLRALAARQVVLVHDDASYARLKGGAPWWPEARRMAAVGSALPGAIVVAVRSEDPSAALEQQVRGAMARGRSVVYARGNDMWDFPGRDALVRAGVPVLMLPYTPGVSSTQLKLAGATAYSHAM